MKHRFEIVGVSQNVLTKKECPHFASWSCILLLSMSYVKEHTNTNMQDKDVFSQHTPTKFSFGSLPPRFYCGTFDSPNFHHSHFWLLAVPVVQGRSIIYNDKWGLHRTWFFHLSSSGYILPIGHFECQAIEMICRTTTLKLLSIDGSHKIY